MAHVEMDLGLGRVQWKLWVTQRCTWSPHSIRVVGCREIDMVSAYTSVLWDKPFPDPKGFEIGLLSKVLDHGMHHSHEHDSGLHCEGIFEILESDARSTRM